MTGGECRIRTCGRLAAAPVFKTGAIVHSANSPLNSPYSAIILANFNLKRKKKNSATLRALTLIVVLFFLSYIKITMKLAILIPAYNEEKTLKEVIGSIPRRFPKITKIEIIVVSDGSTDKTCAIARKAKVTLIEHDLNRGLGGALGTGFEYARRQAFDLLVTFDADGQHNRDDIWPVLEPLVKRRADVVVGSRLKSLKSRTNDMPWYRIIGIWGLNLITFLFFWVWTTDSQSGLRAFNRKAIEKIDIQTNKMEVSSEFFYEIGRKGLKLLEVSITSIYTKYSLGKGQKNINGFRIISKLIYRRFFSK